MNKKVLVPVMIAAAMLSACQSNDVYSTDAKKDTSILSKFSDFENVRQVTLNVDYGVKSKVYFQIYDTNPFVEVNGNVGISDTIQSLGIGTTDENGKYGATISLPSSLENIYIVSTDACATPVLMKAVSGNTVSVTSSDKPSSTKGTRSFVSGNTHVIPNALNKNLGETVTTLTGDANAWDDNGVLVSSLQYGTIAGTEQALNASKLISSSLKENQQPTAYLMGKDYNTDLIKEDNGDIVLTYLYGISGAKSTLAYYCYTQDNPTANQIEKMKKCIVFANTYDYNNEYGPMNAMRGVQVKLKYIDANGNFQDTWPANAKVGFVLYNNGWQAGQLQYAYYSTPISNTNLYTTDGGNNVFTACSTLSYTYNERTYALLGFEDWRAGGGDFNDVIIQLAGVKPTISVTSETDTLSSSTRGVLGFEDNWPNKGDYDMNDMVVKYNTTYSFGRLTQAFNGSQISQTDYKLAITDEFTLTWTGADYKNGFGYEVTLDNDAKIDEITVTHNGKTEKASVVSEGNNKYIIYLFDDAKSELGVSGYKAASMPADVTPQTYTVTIPYNHTEVTAQKYADRGFNPFMTVNGNKAKEVHLIDKAPTSAGTACGDLFNTADDCSNPDQSQYFRSNSYMPYAININADGTDNSNGNAWNINLKKESVAIQVTYPKFVQWAEEGNTSTIKWWNN